MSLYLQFQRPPTLCRCYVFSPYAKATWALHTVVVITTLSSFHVFQLACRDFHNAQDVDLLLLLL